MIISCIKIHDMFLTKKACVFYLESTKVFSSTHGSFLTGQPFPISHCIFPFAFPIAISHCSLSPTGQHNTSLIFKFQVLRQKVLVLMMFNRLLFKINNLSLVVIQLTYRNTDSVGDQVMQAKTADNVKHADYGAHSVQEDCSDCVDHHF